MLRVFYLPKIGLACALVLMPGFLGAQQDAVWVDGGAEDAATLDATLGVDQASADAAPGCGAITYRGQCEGDRLLYCVAGNLREIDCASPASFPHGGPQVTCGLSDCLESGCQGYWCVAKIGVPCGMLGCDVGQGQGCLAGVCSESVTCDPASFTPRCEGDRYIYCGYTESDLDCSAAGQRPFTCLLGEADDDPCVGLPGADCNPLVGKNCAPGLSCLGERCVIPEDGGWVEDAGWDASFSAADASRSTRDAGQQAGEGRNACLCIGAPGRLPGLPLLVLTGLVWLRRWRSFALREGCRERINAAGGAAPRSSLSTGG